MAESSSFKAVQAEFDNLVKAVTANVAGLARKAFQENLISLENLREAENKATDAGTRASTMLCQILTKIEQDRIHFTTLLSILESIPVLKEQSDKLKKKEEEISSDSSLLTSSQSEKHEHPDPKSPFTCLCCGSTVSIPFSSDCLEMAESSQFPYLDIKKNLGLKTNVEAKLLSDTQDMIRKFNNLLQSTCKSLENRNIPPEAVAMTALTISAMGPGAVCEPILKDHEDTISCAQSNTQILLILIKYMSFFNHEILKEIISNHGSEQDQQNLEKYMADFNHFCKRSVFEVPPTVYGQASDNPEKRKMFAVKLTSAQNVKGITLKEVLSARERIAKIIGLNPASLYLCHIEAGCVELTFMIPSYVVHKVFPLNETKIALLKEHGISVITDPLKTKREANSKISSVSTKRKHPVSLQVENKAPEKKRGCFPRPIVTQFVDYVQHPPAPLPEKKRVRIPPDTHSLLDFVPFQVLVY